ncbi:unnamed protein product [Moneuplotes crassus]|uniref:Uncharacterized protein n=1 Tax=Euplotes crassus TaxID=5936 RepID=A0AAD1XD91_EUPCR|nr:unnamed protein product [Moneuplotes crassus]
MESMSRAIQDRNSQIISLEKPVLEETKEQDITRCQSILHNVYPKQFKIQPLVSDFEEVPTNSQLWINFSDLRYVKFAQSMKYLKFFNINSIWFDDVDSKNKRFVDFLETSFPDKTNELCFRSDDGLDLNSSNYLNTLIRLSSKVTQKVEFIGFYIGLPQLKRLVAAYKHVRVLKLFYCSLSIPNTPDFSKALINCQIQELSLEGSGCSYKSDWGNNFDEFENLALGLASSPDLSLSLKKVYIYDCGVTQNEAEQIFEENQFKNVEIIEEVKF